MAFLVKITRKYQITILKKIREKLNLRVGDLLKVELEDDKIVLRPLIKREKDPLEEMLTGKVGELIHIEEAIIREDSKVKYHYVILYYTVVNISGYLRASGDVTEVRWFSLTEAESLKNITPGTKKY